MSDFDTEVVMDKLRFEIKQNGLCTSQLSYVSPYHNKLLQQLIRLNEIIIFGAGEYGRIVLEDLRQHGVTSVKCFCDNSQTRIGRCIEEIKVLSFDEAKKKYPNACYVITPKGHEEEILKQIVNGGVEVDRTYLFIMKNTGLVVE